MKKLLAIVLALLLTASLLAACGGAPASVSQPQDPLPPVSSSEPEPEPEPPYNPDPLTGEDIAVTGYRPGTRLTAVMVNNIKDARPQSGLTDAGLVIEIMVEGGITRFCALYNDYTTMPVVGPIRSARDQFFRLICPWQPLYVHDGESVVQSQYVRDYNYQDLNIMQVGQFTWRDPNRVAPHNEYTNGENLTQYFMDAEKDVNRDYNNYTFFNYVNYNEPERVLDGDEAEDIKIVHSYGYSTYFDYSGDTMTYYMSQNSNAGVTPTIDVNNGQQLNYKNVLVLFTDIHTYPGHEEKNLQYADYNWGGVGYYFCNGKREQVRWLKGSSAWEGLRIVSADGRENPVYLNPGKTYLAIVDIDQAENLLVGNAAVVQRTEDNEDPITVTSEVELGD